MRNRLILLCPGVGAVEATGASATKFQKGQRVIAAGWGAIDGNGTWQQYKVVPESSLVGHFANKIALYMILDGMWVNHPIVSACLLNLATTSDICDWS